MKVLIVGTDLNGTRDLKTQGQFLRDLLRDHNVDVALTSRHRKSVLRILDTIMQILRLKKTDIVIVQVYSTRGIYLEVLSVWLSRLKKCYVISTLHGGNIPNVYRTDKLKHRLLNVIFRYSSLITAPGKFIPSQIEKIRDTYQLIPNHIDLKDYRDLPKPGDTIRIFWMRSYHPTYDPIKAIRVLEHIRARGIDAKLIMAGKDFGYKSAVEEVVSHSEYAADIRLYDVIHTEEKNRLAGISNVYLCTNTIDNAPVSFLEMMAMGLPIVTTNAGGIPYYVDHNKTALLSETNSAEDLAGLIIDLNKDKQLRDTLISNGKLFIREYSSEVVLQKWLAIFSKSSNI